MKNVLIMDDLHDLDGKDVKQHTRLTSAKLGRNHSANTQNMRKKCKNDLDRIVNK